MVFFNSRTSAALVFLTPLSLGQVAHALLKIAHLASYYFLSSCGARSLVCLLHLHLWTLSHVSVLVLPVLLEAVPSNHFRFELVELSFVLHSSNNLRCSAIF